MLVTQLCLTLCDPWTAAHQVPLSMEFSRQEYWSGWPFPSPADLPKPGIEHGPPAQQQTLPTEPPGIQIIVKCNRMMRKWLVLNIYSLSFEYNLFN